MNGVDIGRIDMAPVRHAWDRLAAIGPAPPTAHERAARAQEELDFLAMVAGLKPVFLLGRGYGSPDWISAVRALGVELGLQCVEGPLWDATPWHGSTTYERFPGWYIAHCADALAQRTAFYVSADRETADDLAAIARAGGRLSISDEARLLGYPECCVEAHYERALLYHRATLLMLERLSGGDEAGTRALLRGGANMAPATEDEIALLDAAYALVPATFGSWNMCPACAAHPDNLSGRWIARNRAFAEEVDDVLVAALVG